jgi:hypothetical protein
MLLRHRNCLISSLHAQFLVQVTYVGAYHIEADDHCVGDLLVRVVGRQQHQHARLLLRQLDRGPEKSVA